MTLTSAVVIAGGGAYARVTPMSTAFTFQGQLKQGGNPVNATADFQFTLFDALSGPNQVAGPVAVNNVMIANGLFSVPIDFGANVFNGEARWLQIAVRSPAGSGSFTTLTPRQPLNAAPYALQTRGIHVDAAGNAGIGTVAPGKKLTVAGSMEIGLHNADYQHLRIGGGNSHGFLYGSFPHFGDGIHLGYNYYADAAGNNVVIHPDGGTSRLSMGYGSIVLATAGPFFSEPQNRLVVLADGRVGVGTVSPGYPLHVRAFNGTSILGETSFGFSGAGVWGLATSPNGNATGVLGECFSPSGWDFFAAGAGINYGASSSIRWKRNIEAIDAPLDRISRIRGVFFDWDQAHGGQHDVGMIAEEVGEVLPEVVQYEANGIDASGMDYSKLTPLLVEALKALRDEKDAEIQSLRDEADALKSENQQQQALIAELIKRVEALEAQR